jgi:histidinol dehydrogenase
VPVRRFDARSWAASPLSRRGVDWTQLANERAAVSEICSRVRTDGDEALRDLGRQFDGWAPGHGETFAVPAADVTAAAHRLPEADRSALEFAAARIEAFHRGQVQVGSNEHTPLEIVTRAVRRAGIYAPGGRAVYPSTVLMTAIPARVAGVDELALATPPRPDGTVPDAILAAAQIAGVDTVYRVGGAQAIAAFAYGTKEIPRVDLIAGPGNIYVTLAKKEVFGSVGIDGIAGPTEIAIVADANARADFVAADLAAQLEHDPRAWGVLFTESEQLADRVEEELASLLRGLARAEIIQRANCCIVVAGSVDRALELADEFAPEHMLVVAEDAALLAGQVRNAGAVFVGPYATVPLGDYTAGPNHTLPTSGAARFASPLGVHTFLKRTSILRLTRRDVEELGEATVRLAHLEGLGAHAHAVEVRLE